MVCERHKKMVHLAYYLKRLFAQADRFIEDFLKEEEDGEADRERKEDKKN